MKYICKQDYMILCIIVLKILNYGGRYPPVHCFISFGILTLHFAIFNLHLAFLHSHYALYDWHSFFCLLTCTIVICIWLSDIAFCNLWLTSFILNLILCIVRFYMQVCVTTFIYHSAFGVWVISHVAWKKVKSSCSNAEYKVSRHYIARWRKVKYSVKSVIPRKLVSFLYPI